MNIIDFIVVHNDNNNNTGSDKISSFQTKCSTISLS